MRFVNLISLDDAWSAFGLKKHVGEVKRAPRKKNPTKNATTKKFIDKERRVVKAPPDLAKALKKSKRARAEFDSLAFTHKKEFVEWILQAKQAATRQRRVEGTMRRLMEREKAKPRGE
jgi:uncharacterized protein YdeI (YjbR/CyaY-like superfamily)